MKPYYYVYEYGNKAPRVRHATLHQADTEAKRLAGISPGTTFEVLMAVGITRVTTPQTFWMDGVTPPESGPLTNDLARAKFKEKLLQELMVDLMVCKIEGWSITDYISDLKTLIDETASSILHNAEVSRGDSAPTP